METRASKKRANTAAPILVNNQQHKKKRVVLGELPNLPNFLLPATLNQPKQKLQCRKNPKLKKPASNLPLPDFKSEKPFNSDEDATCNDPRNSEPYVSDIFNYLHSMEMEKKRRPMIDYIQKVQRGVTTNMRGILVDWLVEVAEEYKLLSDTLYLSVSYIDRFLSVNPVTKSKLQLLGVSSMLIASKYEEISPPKARDFCSITDNTYNKKEVVKMEADILKALNFEMGNPTVNTFLRRFAGIASENQNTLDLKTEFLGNYLAELSLLDCDCIRFLPSIVAASVIFLARFIINPEVHPWTSSLCECSGYKSAELKECVLILHDLYLSRRAASFQAIREKYKQHKFKYVANLPSPPEVPNNYFEEQ